MLFLMFFVVVVVVVVVLNGTAVQLSRFCVKFGCRKK
jgi:hypothetical protein